MMTPRFITDSTQETCLLLKRNWSLHQKAVPGRHSRSNEPRTTPTAVWGLSRRIAVVLGKGPTTWPTTSCRALVLHSRQHLWTNKWRCSMGSRSEAGWGVERPALLSLSRYHLRGSVSTPRPRLVVRWWPQATPPPAESQCWLERTP